MTDCQKRTHKIYTKPVALKKVAGFFYFQLHEKLLDKKFNQHHTTEKRIASSFRLAVLTSGINTGYSELDNVIAVFEKKSQNRIGLNMAATKKKTTIKKKPTAKKAPLKTSLVVLTLSATQAKAIKVATGQDVKELKLVVGPNSNFEKEKKI